MATRKLEYYINLDERGEFSADVRAQDTDETIFEIHGFDIFEDGYMDSKRDMEGLFDYMEELGMAKGFDSHIQYMG